MHKDKVRALLLDDSVMLSSESLHDTLYLVHLVIASRAKDIKAPSPAHAFSGLIPLDLDEINDKETLQHIPRWERQEY
jgi:hypothetical protein